MPRLSSATETWHPSNNAVYTNDVDSSVVLVTPVRSGVFRHSLSFFSCEHAPANDPLRHGMINCSCRQDGLQVSVATDFGQRVGWVRVDAKERELRDFHAIVRFSHTTKSIINRISAVVDDFVMSSNNDRLSVYMSMSTLRFRIVCRSCFSEYAASNSSANSMVSVIE
jgi:hypothetical protein